MPLLRGGRPLKAWTYVGAFGPDLMLCTAGGRIGVVPFSWWAVWDGERLIEGRRGLAMEVSNGAAIEVVSPHGRQYAWTRKRVARARGTFDGRPFDLAAIVDESAGYHARHTSWRWSAGVGTLVSGEPVAWNLVDGLRFTAVATRSRRENLLLVRSDYEQPFGTFAGELPGAGELREGWGMMERHDVRW
jgi:hypothetical protein